MGQWSRTEWLGLWIGAAYFTALPQNGKPAGLVARGGGRSRGNLRPALGPACSAAAGSGSARAPAPLA